VAIALTRFVSKQKLVRNPEKPGLSDYPGRIRGSKPGIGAYPYQPPLNIPPGCAEMGGSAAVTNVRCGINHSADNLNQDGVATAQGGARFHHLTVSMRLQTRNRSYPQHLSTLRPGLC